MGSAIGSTVRSSPSADAAGAACCGGGALRAATPDSVSTSPAAIRRLCLLTNLSLFGNKRSSGSVQASRPAFFLLNGWDQRREGTEVAPAADPPDHSTAEVGHSFAHPGQADQRGHRRGRWADSTLARAGSPPGLSRVGSRRLALGVPDVAAGGAAPVALGVGDLRRGHHRRRLTRGTRLHGSRDLGWVDSIAAARNAHSAPRTVLW